MAGFENSSYGRPQRFPKRDHAAYRNFLRAKYEAYTGQVEVTSRPYYLVVDPCDACSLRCPTCPTGIENENRRERRPIAPFRQKRSLMGADLLDSILEELGDRLFLILFYNFGEPLQNKQLPEFVRKATARGIEADIHTHLSLVLTDQYIEDLLSAGLSSLNVSIDGFSQETYQKHRAGGNLDLVRSNLERFVRARDRLGLTTNIVYNWLVFSFNEHEIPAAREYCQSLGITLNPREAFIDDPAWLPSYRKGEVPWTVPEEVQLRPGQPLGWAPPLPSAPLERWPSSCGWHYGYSVVQPAGDVAPCCAVSQQAYDMGNMVPGKVSFGDVWNGDAFRNVRAHFAGKSAAPPSSESPLCIRCPWPQFIQQLFSINDAKVIAGFHEVAADADPLMVEAFDLFTQIRYGVTTEAFSRSSGVPGDYLFVGNEGVKATAAFVNFVRTYLPEEQLPAS